VSRDEFDALVKRLEPFAQEHPRAYFARVALLACFGYLFWILILGALLFALGGLAALACYYPGGTMFKVSLVLGAVDVWMFFAILRSIGVQLEAPEGFEVHRNQSPALFGLLDELSTELRAPRFHHVLLSSDYNASVAQVPRLGVLGWQKNFLVLGLPLLQGLTRSQVRAVLAHELAHLSANHSRFRSWIYRVRRSWEQVLQRMLAEQHVGTLLFLRFFEWYAPYFNAYTFVLARANEYEADRSSAHLAGVETTAEALIQVQVQARFVEDVFWPDMMRVATQQETPEIGAFTRLGQQLGSQPNGKTAQNWLNQALTVETNNADTHPCLLDRLRAIGYAPALSLPNGPAASPAKLKLPPHQLEETGAQLLGGTLEACVRALEMHWERRVRQEWRERYQQAQKERSRVAALEQAARERTLSPDEHCERARIVLDHQGESEARPLLRALLQEAPDHPYGNFLLGRLLLDEGDSDGVPMIELAMTHDPEVAQIGYTTLYQYHRRHGGPARQRDLEKRYEDHRASLRFARLERQTVDFRDTFLEHGLGATQLEELRQQLAAYSQIKRAHLVRKEVKFFPRQPCYVLVVELNNFGTISADTTRLDQASVRRLADDVRLPGPALVFSPTGSLEAVGKMIRAHGPTLIYERHASCLPTEH
jgi:Zn-dependent protease with chaperone function